MAITKYESRTGGKICKLPLRQAHGTPYERPPANEAHGIRRTPPANEAAARGLRWFTKLVDPGAKALRVIVGNVTSLFFSVFGKGSTPGETIRRTDELPEMKSTVEVREQGKNTIDVRLSICYDGGETSKQELISRTEATFQLKQLLNQKRFTRTEIGHFENLVHSKTFGPSRLPLAYYKNEKKISKDSCINSNSSHQVAKDEENEKGVNINIGEKDFEYSIKIARAYLASKPRKATPSIVRMHSKYFQGDKSQFGNRLARAIFATKSASVFPTIDSDSLTSSMPEKPRGKSVCDIQARHSYFSDFMRTHHRVFKRARDERQNDDARRVRQKSCLEDLNLPTHPDPSS